MAEDSMTTPPTEGAPAEADTQTTAAPDTEANTPQPQQPTDSWEARYKALQAEKSRKETILAAKDKQLRELLASAGEDEDGDAPAPTRKVAHKSEREAALEAALLQRDWQIAEAIFPPDVIESYGVFANLFNQAQTPADYISAAEAYHQNRVKGAAPQQAAAPGPAPTSVMPRSDSNRSDAPSLPEIEQKLREAEKKHDLGAWVSAKLAGAARE